MDSLEKDVIIKLNNVFQFKFKTNQLQQFESHDILNVYQFLLRVYDQSWLLNGDKPMATLLKQIQT